ncbi:MULTISPECIES: response regulator transcription factor [unclassified Rhizobium]|uniref:response regulator transcription factor n=1 Tax=unclassified Rhizobium TaxID=2613769 RepID=UPI0007EA1663|nr:MULTISPECIES: response regulator transcription factor [unclassified Rhizobium]ANM13540.1 response regulator CheY-like domain-containing protein [Rhizobium sp. N324]OYD00573.1 response regulator CheY-like domain-containing protein [Rhizobium sp. N4311]
MSFSDLVGRHVLVAEDDYDQAQDMARAIEKHGGDVVGPYPDIEAAFLALGKAAIDAAVLDIRLNAEDVFPLADVLREKASLSSLLPGSTGTCCRSDSAKSK